MSQLYRQLCNLFIRPTRQQYSPYDLGSPIIDNVGKRKDFDLHNPRGMIIKCSFFEPTQPYQGCVVYLHSLNGSRLESAHLAKRFLNLGIAFANLDMSGSGHSEGEYVSLGFHERLDAKVLIEHLHANFGIKLFGIWGRSMGAVTALNAALELQNHSQSLITCAVLDSPYYSLMDLSMEIADKKIGLPSLLVRAGMMLIKGSIEEKVRFRLDDLEMKDVVKHLRIPLLILASKEDQLINWHHSEKIYNQYLSKDKELLFIKGSHSAARDEDVISKIVNYMQKSLKVGEHKLRRNLSTVGEPFRQQRQIVTVKSSENIFSESVSPMRKVRSITPSYVAPRQSIKISDKYKLDEIRFKTQKTIYEQQENFPTATTMETEEHSHLNIISQKLLKMRPKQIIGGIKKFSESKPFEDEQPSPRKGEKVHPSNTRLLKLKKKPNINPTLLENNKLNHNPYLTNANLVKFIEEEEDI